MQEPYSTIRHEADQRVTPGECVVYPPWNLRLGKALLRQRRRHDRADSSIQPAKIQPSQDRSDRESDACSPRIQRRGSGARGDTKAERKKAHPARKPRMGIEGAMGPIKSTVMSAIRSLCRRKNQSHSLKVF
jgi:hypothetical protein